MVRKLFLVGLLALNLASALPALAAETIVAPEFNPLCWKRAKCDATRRQLVGSNSAGQALGDGFVEGPDAYPCEGDKDNQEEGPWGKCLPANITVTEIAFGGERRFANVGDFIQKNYRLAIILAGVVASVVVVLSGLQWATSGGNAETISSAKGRIGNAIIGLFIAYTSYFILNTINPNLVNLRLPQTWLLRPFESVPKFCSAAKKESKFMFVTSDQTIKDVKPPSGGTYNVTYDQLMSGDGKAKNCGDRYLIEDSGTFPCYASFCGQGICTNFNPANENQTTYDCVSAALVGKVIANYIVPPVCKIVNGYTFPYIDPDGFNKLYKVCSNEAAEDLAGKWRFFAQGREIQTFPNAEKNFTGFVVNRADFTQDCPAGTNFIGYALGLNLDQNCTFFGDDDETFINKNGAAIGPVGGTFLDDWVGSGYFLQVERTRPSKSNLIQPEDLINGLNVVIDVGQIIPQ